MAIASTASDLRFSASHSGRTELFTLPCTSATLADLQHQLLELFDVEPSAQKILLQKGKKLQLRDPTALISTLLPPNTSTTTTPLKLLLIGPTSTSLTSLLTSQSLRQQKHSAYLHHAAHPHAPVRNTTDAAALSEKERWRFGVLRPFGGEVPCFEERRRMLERLSEDRAVRDLMERHKFVVGVLTELHPITQPTLLGLNKNAGEEISLRLLTDDLTGTRSYAEVRKVLCHELAHNRIGPHDDSFKTLNSLLNREVLTFEAKHGLSVGSTSLVPEPWEPEGPDYRSTTSHVLGEKEKVEEWGGPLRWGEEEEVEMRRERVRMAAEGRLKREKEAGRR
ncbi:WLM domain-domain-containing protein [Leucosporidium creatinivorum]|uniref:WLM domain-domain-containing protein n=1 Tax=Leucosporidium creatinivorum TaxID=106004 RepID=A0A1Y2G3L1_9BASI|nr:WLM domain-domain-containing protein [Leucosporidium creatinivorum]